MKKRMIMLLFLLSGTYHVCTSQSDEYLAKALFLLDIAKNTAFPEDPVNEYTITVIGDSPVYNELEHHTAHMHILGLPVKLVQVEDLFQLKTSQMVYLSSEKSHLLHDLLKETSGKPVVIIGEQPGLYKAGAAFSFVQLNDNKWQVDVNEVPLEDRNIKLSKNLDEIFHKSK